MVGEYAKRKYIVNGIRKYNPEWGIYPDDSIFKRKISKYTLPIIHAPKLMQNATLDVDVRTPDFSDSGQSNSAIDDLENHTRTIRSANIALDTANSALGFTKVGSEISNAAAPVFNAIGGVTSGILLGKDIYDAVNDKHVSFDDAMKISDDATGVASAIGTAINPLLGLGIMAGEKLVTGIVKGTKAVEDEKKREGVKHLKPDVWLNTIWEANTPDFMNKDIGKMIRDYKKR